MASKKKKSADKGTSQPATKAATPAASAQVEETGRSLLSVIGWILAGAFLLLFVSYVFFDDNNSSNLDPQTQQKYEVAQQLYSMIRPNLSKEGQQSLDIVMDYISDDPNVLNLDADEHPVYIVEAFEVVKSEIKDAVGSGESPEDNVKVGDKFTITGVLEQTDETTAYGPLFKVRDESTGADLYFIFDEKQLKKVEEEDMLGQRVVMEIKVTDVSDGKIAYYVTSGPDLAE